MYDPPPDPSGDVLLTSGASSSRAINGDCVRGRPVSHAAVQADEVAHASPVGRSIIDGGTEEEREALLNWYGAQRRRAAVSEPVVSSQSVFPGPSQDWSAWYRPSVRLQLSFRMARGHWMVIHQARQVVIGCVCMMPSKMLYWMGDPVMMRVYMMMSSSNVMVTPSPPGHRPQLLVSTPLYNKFVGRFPVHCFGWRRMRNVKIGQLAVADRVYVGEVVRHGNQTWVHHVVGRRGNTIRSAWPIVGGHHVGAYYIAHDCKSGTKTAVALARPHRLC